jgi:hypothetical protein
MRVYRPTRYAMVNAVWQRLLPWQYWLRMCHRAILLQWLTPKRTQSAALQAACLAGIDSQA